MSKKLSKYNAAFDYFDKSLIVLSAASGGVSFVLFVTVIEAPLGITGIVKKLKTTQNKKKKQNSIVMLARIKLNIIESKIYEALANN